jgi:hypothetical protein
MFQQPTRVYGISFIVLLIAIYYGIFAILDSGWTDQFYIFTPEKLHLVQQSAIAQHGNNTKALVASIVEQLSADESIAPYLSETEEWWFNNAGGAMGALFIIHASMYYHPSLTIMPGEMLTKRCRFDRIPHNLRHSHRHRRPHRPPHRRRLFPHYPRHPTGFQPWLIRT